MEFCKFIHYELEEDQGEQYDYLNPQLSIKPQENSENIEPL